MKTKTELKQGTPVMCNGYKGAIIRRYDGDMYEIRLERGAVCTDAFTVIKPAQPQATTHSPRWKEVEALLEKALEYQKQATIDARNHAEALAEALRDALPTISAASETGIAAYNKARQALANWEKAKQ